MDRKRDLRLTRNRFLVELIRLTFPCLRYIFIHILYSTDESVRPQNPEERHTALISIPERNIVARISDLTRNYVYFRSPFTNESVREDDMIVGKCSNVPSTLVTDILYTTVPDRSPEGLSIYRIVGVRVR